jgi:hypothetical protein
LRQIGAIRYGYDDSGEVGLDQYGCATVAAVRRADLGTVEQQDKGSVYPEPKPDLAFRAALVLSYSTNYIARLSFPALRIIHLSYHLFEKPTKPTYRQSYQYFEKI